MTTQSESDQGSARWSQVGLSLLILLLGIADAVRETVTRSALLGETPVGAVLLATLPGWVFWAAMVPLLHRAARRFDLGGEGRLVAMAAHAGLFIAVWAAHSLILTWFGWRFLLGGESTLGSLGANLRLGATSVFILDAVVYGLVVGAWYAARTRRALEEGRLREMRVREQLAQARAGEAEARLSALRMEINPHFLFNVLNGVAGLIRSGRGWVATSMLARLADLLRMTLRPSDEREISLRDELALLSTYLEIERMRFDERLRIQIDVPAELQDAALPPFILQPLVENAIRHGLHPSREGLSIRIGAASHPDDRLVVSVEDDGPGFDDAPARGVGLSNVESRLEALHGASAHLALGRSEIGGARVALRLPLRYVVSPRHTVPGPP